MAKKREKKPGAADEAKPHTRNMVQKQYTIDQATIDGLETIQAEVPELMGASAALRYAVRETVARLTQRKPPRGKP